MFYIYIILAFVIGCFIGTAIIGIFAGTKIAELESVIAAKEVEHSGKVS